MAAKNRPFVIALEEHYWTPTWRKPSGAARRAIRRCASRLDDLGALRIKEWTKRGIDVQVISHGAPSTQRLDVASAVPFARPRERPATRGGARHRALRRIRRASTADPKAAADELERAVTKLGFKGAMVHGPTQRPCSSTTKRFWPIFERAQALDVRSISIRRRRWQAVADAYYKDYLDKFPQLLTAAWGYTVETATHGIRMILSGAFDRYLGLEGHPRASGRVAALLRVAHQHGALARGRQTQPRSATPSASISGSPRAATSPPRADVLHHGDGRGSDPLLGGLPVSFRTRRERNGWRTCLSPSRTAPRSSPATRSAC